MKKNNFMILITSIALGAFLTSCTGTSLKIGLMADLTGRASGLGISSRNGAELAVQEINSAGGIKGRKIELIVVDDKGLPQEAAKADEELVKQKILLGIGHMASGPGLSGLEVFNKAGILMVSPLMSTESLTGIDDIFIRVIGSNRKQGELLAEAALAKNLNKDMAILYEYNNKEYSKVVCDYFKKVYEKGGGKIVYESSFLSSSETDFQKTASEIIKSGASGALIVSGGVDLGVLVQLLKKQKPEMKIFSGMWGMTEDAIAKGGKFIKGAYFAGVYDSRNQNPEFVSFRKKYMERYKEEPTFASLYTYETFGMVAEALKASEKYDTTSIKKQILHLSKFKGLGSNFSIDRYGDSDRGYLLFQVQNDEYVRVE